MSLCTYVRIAGPAPVCYTQRSRTATQTGNLGQVPCGEGWIRTTETELMRLRANTSAFLSGTTAFTVVFDHPWCPPTMHLLKGSLHTVHNSSGITNQAGCRYRRDASQWLQDVPSAP